MGGTFYPLRTNRNLLCLRPPPPGTSNLDSYIHICCRHTDAPVTLLHGSVDTGSKLCTVPTVRLGHNTPSSGVPALLSCNGSKLTASEEAASKAFRTSSRVPAATALTRRLFADPILWVGRATIAACIVHDLGDSRFQGTGIALVSDHALLRPSNVKSGRQ